MKRHDVTRRVPDALFVVAAVLLVLYLWSCIA